MPSSSIILLILQEIQSFEKFTVMNTTTFGAKAQLIQNLTSNYPHFNKETIYLTLITDGIPFSKSSKSSCWPIFLCCNICPKTVFPIAISYGDDKSKPDNTIFLRESIEELRSLNECGVIYNGKHISIIIHCIICDAPTISMVKRVKGHSGYYACDICDQNCDYKDGRVVFAELDATLRTNDSFGEHRNEEHHVGYSLSCR